MIPIKWLSCCCDSLIKSSPHTYRFNASPCMCKSCRSSWFESQIINIKLRTNFKKVPSPLKVFGRGQLGLANLWEFPTLQMWPSILTMTMTLTYNFQGQIFHLLSHRKELSRCHETENKFIDWALNFKCGNQFVLGHDLDLAFSRLNIAFA